MSTVKAITVDIIENNYTRRVLFKVLIGTLLTFFIIYMYFIGSITFNVLASKSFENEIQSLSSDISQLELTYLDNLNEVDKDYATSRGFVDAQNNIFATRSINHVAIR